MIPGIRIPTHPGIILLKEFLEPMNISQIQFAKHVNVPVQRINEIIRGKRGVSSQTAWLLSQALGTSPEFWINLQSNLDLALNRPEKEIHRIVSL